MKKLAKLSQTVKNGFCHLIIKLLLYCFGVVYPPDLCQQEKL